MKKASTKIIDQAWPENGLEHVNQCPFCDSGNRMVAYKDVQDWSFYCARGKWTYWNCMGCQAIYLDPRPTEETIVNAYNGYYTHGVNKFFPYITEVLKEIVKNECFYQWLRVDLKPRLHIPKVAAKLLLNLKNYISIPFGLEELENMPRGYLLDIGCGSGRFLSIARQLGWKTIGIEMDPKASAVARSKGLEIIQDTYRYLDNFTGIFDCIICAHVLEHVHYPNEMLSKIEKALKPHGKLLLSLPNSTSKFRYLFGENWRGLEAPRHLAIPSANYLKERLQYIGFVVETSHTCKIDTTAESLRIQRRSNNLKWKDRANARLLRKGLQNIDFSSADIIQFLCTKNPINTAN
jgi:2-polyprenyl-3-methyl-5-hydroxy-6-metoxy-1,4-benzoquinol methylase